MLVKPTSGASGGATATVDAISNPLAIGKAPSTARTNTNFVPPSTGRSKNKADREALDGAVVIDDTMTIGNGIQR